MAEDAAKLFEVYWELAKIKTVPKTWSQEFSSEINIRSPQLVDNLDTGHYSKVYLGSSPKAFCPYGRTDDLRSIFEY